MRTVFGNLVLFVALFFVVYSCYAEDMYIFADWPRSGSMLEGLINKTLSQHPNVLVEKANKEATLIDIDIARKQRYPRLEMQSDLLSLRSRGGAGGVATVVSVEQPLWTFGRLEAGIDGSVALDRAQSARIQEVKYDLALRVVDVWQELTFAQQRLLELEETTLKLNEYRGLMKRRVDSKVSPTIELALIGARVAQLDDDIQQAKAAQGVALAKLERLLGEGFMLADAPKNVSLDSLYEWASGKVDERILGRLEMALQRHPSVVSARQQAEYLKFQLKARRAAQYPEVYVRAQANIYSASSDLQNNQALFLGLRYQPGSGFSVVDFVEKDEARLASQQQAVESIKRDIGNSIGVDYEVLVNAVMREATLQRARSYSSDVMASYERQFVAGRRTWQDVLNSVRENNDNRIALANAKSTAVAAIYRIGIRMSEMDWQKNFLDASD